MASGEVTGAIQPSPTVSEQIAQAVLGGMLSCMSGPERFATGALERCGAEAKEKALAIGGREDEINQMIADVSSQLSERLHLSAPVAERLDAMQELHLVDTVRDSLRSCAREHALPTVNACIEQARDAAGLAGFSEAWADIAVERVRDEWRAAAERLDAARQ